MNNTPAILGNSPIFDSKVYIVKPRLPELGDMSEELKEMFASGMITKGKLLAKFENDIAEHLGVKHAVAVSSCTIGMMLVHKALGLTGEVVMPSFTFMATAGAAVWAGLKPVFADADRETTTLDPASAESVITPNTSAIVAVHNFGNPADMDELQSIADKHGLKLIYDAAHGFGATYKGVAVGGQGDAQVYSLSPTKLLTTGEGGIVATNNDDLAAKIKMGREYGNDGNYDSAFAGLNGRMPEFSALMGIYGLKLLEEAAQHRNKIVDLFHEELGKLPGISFQKVREGNRNSYREFSIMVHEEEFGLTRDELAMALTEENIDTRKYYDPPVHRQTAYRQFAPSEESLPNTNWLSAHSLALPIWSHMSTEIAANICVAIQRYYEFSGEIKKSVNESRVSSVSQS